MAQRRAAWSRGTGGRRVGASPQGRPGGRGRPFRIREAVTESPRPRLTSRAAVLVLVLAVLVVSYASSLRAYFEQRRQMQQLAADIEASRADIASLQRERKRWQDPAYVVSQARARFAFGFPGEVGFRVLGVDGKPLDQQDSLSDPRPAGDGRPEWWRTTLNSIQVAGNPPPQKPAPATRISAPRQPKSAAPAG